MLKVLILAVVSLNFAFQFWRDHKMSQALDDLKTALADNTTAVQAAVTEIAALVAGSDTAALQDITTQLQANTKALNDAVTPPPV